MKFKKILLFILIFLFLIFLSSNVKGYVLNDGGVEKYYLPDLPVSGNNLENIFLFNNSTNQMLLLVFPETYFLGYDRVNNIFVLYNEDGSQVANDFPDLLSFYSCKMEYSNLNLIGTKWLEYSKVGTHGNIFNFNYNDYSFIYGTTNLFPCLKDYGVVTSLPEGISWDEDFLLAYSSGFNSITMFYPNFNNTGIFASINGQSRYYESIESIEPIWFSLYTLDSSNQSWSYQDIRETTPYCNIDNYFYNNKDIFDSNNRENILLSNINNLFKNLSDNFYNNFPYILNGAEDLAKGNDDIVIMPRGF